jgi:hypothetical protein
MTKIKGFSLLPAIFILSSMIYMVFPMNTMTTAVFGQDMTNATKSNATAEKTANQTEAAAGKTT